MTKKQMKEKGINKVKAKVMVFESWRKDYNENPDRTILKLAWEAMDEAQTILNLLNELELISDEEYNELTEKYITYMM